MKVIIDTYKEERDQSPEYVDYFNSMQKFVQNRVQDLNHAEFLHNKLSFFMAMDNDSYNQYFLEFTDEERKESDALLKEYLDEMREQTNN